jgi:hypothetical protein
MNKILIDNRRNNENLFIQFPTTFYYCKRPRRKFSLRRVCLFIVTTRRCDGQLLLLFISILAFC